MPYKYRKARAGKAPMKKKVKSKKTTKPPSKNTFKQLMRRNPESFSDWTKNKYLYVPFVTAFRFSCSGDTVNQFRSNAITANSCFKPDASSSSQPYFWDQYTTSLSGPWRQYRVERVQVKFDFIDESTINTQPYYVFAVVSNSTSSAIISTYTDLLENRDFGVRPVYSLVQSGPSMTAGGRRRLKIEYDINKPLGLKKYEYQSRTEFIALCSASPTSQQVITYGIVSADGTALPASVVSNINVRVKQLTRLIGRNDVGSS